ncbi:unnamed protein product, partial [Rotaria socialis]
MVRILSSFRLISTFNSKPNQARRLLVLRINNGILAYPQCIRGNNRPLSDSTIDAVVKFYREDGISRTSSNSKDTIKIDGQPVAVRFLEMTLLDAYHIFDERHPGAVARSTFNALRPRKCFNDECDDCPTKSITDILTDNNMKNLDDECSWNLWKKVNNKFDLQQMSGSIDSLLTEIEEGWPLFLLHTHINREQRECIKDLRCQSTDKTFVVAQIDFSMNYTLVRQREVQQGFFSQHQVTLFTIHLTIGKEQRNLAIISDYMEHTTVFVHCEQKVLTQFIKKNFPLRWCMCAFQKQCQHFEPNSP